MKSTLCFIWTAFCVLLLQLVAVSAPAQTLVGGDLLSNTTWTLAGSPYHVMSNLRVVSGVTLQIEPGVVVRFDDQVRMDLEGRLQAQGTALDSVLFLSLSSTPDTGSWLGIKVNAATGGSLDLSFAQIANASKGLEVLGIPSANAVSIANTEFRLCAVGISGWQGATSIVRECGFKENHFGVQSSSLTFRKCAWAANETGVVGGAVLIDSCTFTKHAGSALRDCSGQVEGSLFVSNTIGLLNFGSSPTDSVNGCQFAENDTAAVATGTGATFFGNEFCSNDIQVRLFGSAHASFQSNCWCSLDTNQIATGFIDGRTNAQLGWVLFTPIDTDCNVISQVWPGDANDDGAATIADFLYIGVAYNLTGPQRANATASWAGQAGLPWNLSYDFGPNYKHTDCNGDGLVSLNDTLPILQNFGQTHYKRSGTDSTGGIPVIFEFPFSAGAGETVPVTVYLGDAQTPASGIYGISFVLRPDPGYFQNTATTSLSGTWLGSAGQDLLDLDVMQNGLHWGIVRNDQTDRSGYGKMGGVTLVMIDDLTKPVQLDSAIQIEDVLVIDKKGNPVAADVEIQFVFPASEDPIMVFPTLANARFQVHLDTLTAMSVELYDQNGHLAYRQEGELKGTLDIDSRTLQPGMYIVKVTLPNNVLNRKVFILR